MRNRFSTLFSVLGISLMFLLTATTYGTLHAQCNTAPAVGPVNYTINMGGTQAIITQASLAGVVNPLDGGIAPCNAGCELAYATTGPAGAYTLFSVTPLVVQCNGTSFPFSIWVRAQNGGACNSAPVEVIIDVNDTKAPTIDCPPNQVVSTDPGVCTAKLLGLTFVDVTPLDAGADLEYGDNCGTPSISYNINLGGEVFSPDLSGVDFPEGVNNVVMTVDDGNLTATCNFNVTVNDTEDPTWVAESTVITDWLTAAGVSLASDAIISVTYNMPLTNRLTVTLNCDSDDYGTVYSYFSTMYVPTAQDNCDPNPTENFHDQINVNTPWACPTVEHIRRRWTAVDADGNAIDNTPPGPTQPLAKLDLITLNNDSPEFVIAPMDTTILGIDPMVCGVDLTGSTALQVVAKDDCQGAPTYSWTITSYPPLFAGALASVGNDNNANQFYIPGTYHIIYEAEDVCGNVSIHDFDFTIVDDVDPIVTCPPSQVLTNVLDNCFQNTIWDEATYSDNCPGTLTIDVAGVTLPNNDPVNIVTFSGGGGCVDVSGFQGPIYSAGLWTQSAAGDGSISIAGAPASISMLASTGPAAENVDFTVTTADAGIIYFAWSYTPTPPVSTADFGYLVNGVFTPVILGAANLESGFASFPVNAGDVIGFRLKGENGPDRPTVGISSFQFLCGSSSNIGFASFPVGQSIVTYTVTDVAMNSTTCSFTITVNDEQDPEIICGGNLFLPTICSAQGIPDFTGNISVINENCPDYTITQLPLAGTTLGTIFAPMMPVDGGTFDVTLEITDKGGNKDQCVFTVTLQDNNAPIPDNLPSLLPINPGTTLFTDCHSFMLCAPTATDCNGNVIYGTASIAGATLNPNGCGPGMPGYLINAPGNYAVTWLYDDGNGNFASQVQQVDLFDDTTDPTLNCPPNQVVNTDPGMCTATGLAGITMTEIIPTMAPYLAVVDQPGDGEMIDNCGITQIGWSADTGSSANTANAGTGVYQKGINVVTYTASDAAGNTGTCTFTITVNDLEKPTFTCAASIVLFTGSPGDQDHADCGYTLSGVDTSLDPTNVTDNCPGPISITYVVTPVFLAAGFIPGPNPSSLAGSTFLIDPISPGQAIYTIKWTFTDAMGNTDDCERILWIRDLTNPEIVCPSSPQVRTTSQDGILGDCIYKTSGTEFDPVSTNDNCNIISTVNNYNLSNTLANEDFYGGSVIVIWTVTDVAGNTKTCQFQVVVNDDEVPINHYCPPSVTLPNIAGDCNNTVAWIRPLENDWTDNCDASSDLVITEAISDPGVQAAIQNNSPYNQAVFFSNPQTSFPVGTTTIVYTATDLSNNSSTCIFTVTIEDIEAPNVICPADQVLGMTCGQGQVQNYIPLVTLISDNCSDFTITQSPAAGTSLASVPGLTPADGELFDVTITVTDNNPQGLSTSCTFTVTLDEVSVPVPTIAGPNLAPAFSECNTIAIPAPTAMECGNTIYGIPSQGTLINVSPPVYQYGIGNYFVTWTYVGTNGSVQQSQQITVLNDIVPPVAQCKPVNVNLSASNPGTVTVNATAFNNGSTDNCSIVGYSYSINAGAYSSSKMFGCSDVGVHNVSLEVLDFNGNKGYCNTTLTINDITPPTIVGGCPSNLSFNTSNDGGYDCSGLATILVPDVSDNCDIPIYQLLLDGPNGFMVSNALGNPTILVNLLKGVTLATFAVTDEHGLQSTCSFSITIVDDEFPIITCAASDSRNTSQDGLGDCEYTINGTEFDPISFDDNCPGSTIINSLNGTSSLAGEVLTTGVYPVTWTVADAVGHTTTCTLEITIIDDEAPIINHCQANKTQNVTVGTCNALVTWAPTYGVGTGHVQDNCGINTITQFVSDPSVVPVYPYNQNGPYPPFQINQALFPIGITTISYTVTDINNNTSTCSFTIEVIDNIAPSVVCPPNQTMSTVCANGTVQDYLGLIQNVSDNCPGKLVYTQSPASGTPLANVPGLTPADGESFTVTITVTDPNPLGLSANCSFSVTLDDINLPIPDQAQLLKDSTDCNVLTLSPPTANDCGNVLYGIPDKGNQISFNPPLYEFTAGLYTVIWTYVGTNGSVQQTQQLIVQNDLVPPVMDCDDITINLDATGNASITPAQIDGGSKDNCGIANLSLSKSAFTCSDVGNNTVILTAVDIHGNSNTCSANVLVKDVTAPTFNISNSNITVNCQSVPSLPTVLTNDACGVFTNILTETTTKGLNPSNCNYYTYTITRLWTATDVNNNSSTVQQVINVQDISSPVWTTAMPDTIYGVTNQFDCMGQIFLVVDAFKVTDNCADFSHISVTYNGTNGSSGGKIASGQYPIGETTLTFTAVDPCGNNAVKEVVIIIEDKTPPTAVCVNSITLPLNPQGNLVIPPFIVDNGSYDNCLTPFSTNHVTLAVMPDTFDCDDAGKTFTITLTVTDLAGNTASCPATLTVIDNTIPTLISCAPDVTVNCQASLDPIVLGFPMVSDACGTTFNFTDSKVSVGGTICYNIIRNWSILDGSGNNLNCVQTISVTDNQAPNFTSVLPLNVTIPCGVPVPTPAILAATDNCGTPVSVNISESSTQTNNSTCTDYAYVVTRTWTATDECGNATFHTQTINVVDVQAPVIFGLPLPTDTVTYYTNDFNADSCTVPVVLEAQFIDCQDPFDITIVNDSPVGSGGSSASGKYSADQLYTITFTATDKCGNQSQRKVHIRVIDNSIPNAYCIAQVNVALNSDGLAVITPVQIDDVSKDNCTAYPNLDFSLSKDSFDCKNLGVNIIQMTVTDEQGNSNTCSASVNVTADPALTINTTVTVTPETFMNANDGAINVAVSGGSGSFTYQWTPGNAVTPSISGLASGTYTLMITDVNTGCMKTLNVFVQIAGVPFDTISGLILTPGPLHKPVARVYVNMTGSQSGTYYTGLDGYYEFIVPSGSTVTIRPSKDTLPSNGVTALDFSIIQQHILAPPNLKPLTTPYQLIAADENGNNQINGIDIAQFNFTILNNKDTFPNVDSWVFVDSTFVFPMPLEPWASGWDDEITYAVISGNKPNSTFIAVKMGDVNGDVDVTKFTGDPTGSDTRRNDDLIFSFQDKVLQSGDQISVPVTSANFNQILAYQFAWGFDPEVLEFAGSIGNALAGLTTGNFGSAHLKDGLLTHLWATNQPLNMDPNAVLFTLYFTVLQDGYQLADVLGLRNSYVGQLAYTYPNLTNGVGLEIKPITNDPSIPTTFTLLGNRPNPFSDQTLITFTLPEKANVKMTILDLTGRPIVVRQMEGVPGINTIPVHQSEIAAPGLYHYILESNGSRVLGKMIHQD